MGKGVKETGVQNEGSWKRNIEARLDHVKDLGLYLKSNRKP